MRLDNVHAFQGDAHGIAKRMRRSEQRPVEPNGGETFECAASSLARYRSRCYIAAALVELAN